MTAEQPAKPHAKGRALVFFDVGFPLVAALIYLVVVGRYLYGSPLDFPEADPLTQLVLSYEVYRSPAILWYFVPTAHPPLQNIVTGLCYAVWGESDRVAYMSVAGMAAFTAIPLYFAGRRLAGRAAGVLATLLFVTSPYTFNLSQYYFTDVSLATGVAAYAACWITNPDFTSRRGSLLAGLSLGAAMLAKYSCVLFVLPMVAAPLATATAYLAQTAWRGKPDERLLGAVGLAGTAIVLGLLGWPVERWARVGTLEGLLLAAALLADTAWRHANDARAARSANIVSAALVTTILALPWYSEQLSGLLSCYYSNFGTVGTFGLTRPQIWAYFTAVLLAMYGGSLFLLPLSVVYPLVSRRADHLWLLATAALGYVIVAAVNTPESREMYPLLPLLCLSAVTWLDGLRKPTMRALAVGVVTAFQGAFWLVPGVAPAVGDLTTVPLFLPPITHFRRASEVRPNLERFRQDMRAILGTVDRANPPRVIEAIDDQQVVENRIDRIMSVEHLQLVMVQEGCATTMVDLARGPVNPSGAEWLVLATDAGRKPEESPAMGDCAGKLRLVRTLDVYPGLQVRVYKII